ncbi:YqfQ family protein [Sutcliffiella horikoshii]|uniref:VrrA/YqfQ family protein n=1 Tax=Sutcliffiella horikoshii TaxID=79883 RepID=UPI0007D05BC3|nr:VrrA/YqfQ family protein [Sutcliffiella horikoshii]MCM3619085.1 YqfQ family protein [Sutcliffiella horikoshii]
MFFGPNRSMPPIQQSPIRMGQSPFMQQPPNNMFNMFNMPNPAMRNMPNMSNQMMMRNPSSFMGGAGRGMGMGGMGGSNGGSGGGGLLARLLGRSGARSIGNMSGLGQMAANTGARGGISQLANAGTLQQLINPNNLTGMLGNVQKALKMAEGVMPMVQQYGPLVRNVPAMIKLYSELKNVDDTDDESEDTATEDTSSEDTEVKAAQGDKGAKKKKAQQKSKPDTDEAEEKPKGGSAPKLYI